jgi:hypothetical protein
MLKVIHGKLVNGNATLTVFAHTLTVNESKNITIDQQRDIINADSAFTGEVYDINECMVCFEPIVKYGICGKHAPKILECGHCICLHCIYVLMDNNAVICPYCNKKHETPVKLYIYTYADSIKYDSRLVSWFTKASALTQLIASHDKDKSVIIYIEDNSHFFENIIKSHDLTCVTVSNKGRNMSSKIQQFRKGKYKVMILPKCVNQFALTMSNNLWIVHPPSMPDMNNHLLNNASHCEIHRLLYRQTVDEFIVQPYGRSVGYTSKKFYILYKYFVQKDTELISVHHVITTLQQHYPVHQLTAVRDRLLFNTDDSQCIIVLTSTDTHGSVVFNGAKMTRNDLLLQFEAPVMESDTMIKNAGRIMELEQELMNLKTQQVCYR